MADDTAERILSVAGPIFARKGYDGATVREICEAAEVNQASVNYHFGDKASLYLETVRRAHEQKSQQVPLPESGSHTTREQRLHGFIQTMMRRLLGGGEDGWQTQLLIREMIEPTHACKSLVEDYIRPQFHRLMAIIDDFVDPQATEAERHQLAISVVGQCLHYRVASGFMTLLLTEDQRKQLLDADRLADAITRFSIAALNHWSSDASGKSEPNLSEHVSVTNSTT